MQSLDTQVIDKLEQELKEYKRYVLTLTPQEIFDKSYETAMKTELVSCFSSKRDDYFSTLPTVLQARLLNAGNLLETLYEFWMDSDTNISEYLNEFLNYYVDYSSFFTGEEK